jgi:hypothetical protein
MIGKPKEGGEYLKDAGAHVYFGGLRSIKGRHDDGHGHGYLDDQGNFKVFHDPYDPRDKAAKSAARTAAPYRPPPARRKR